MKTILLPNPKVFNSHTTPHVPISHLCRKILPVGINDCCHHRTTPIDHLTITQSHYDAITTTPQTSPPQPNSQCHTPAHWTRWKMVDRQEILLLQPRHPLQMRIAHMRMTFCLRVITQARLHLYTMPQVTWIRLVIY